MRKILEGFQQTGCDKLAANYHHLLADEPGLGKTLQAIAAAEKVGARKILVICPASVRTNWAAEVKEWGLDASCRIISYDGASGAPGEEARKDGPYDVVILDEAHFLKSIGAKRTHAVLGKDGLARLGRYIWGLTGTPVLNRPVELYPLLKTLHPVFKDMSYGAFTSRYCGAFFDGRAMNVRGATRIAELANLLSPFITRRSKRQVFPDRKAPLVSRVHIDLSAARFKEVADEETRASGLSLPTEITELGDTSRLLRLLGLAKVPSVVAFVRDRLETVEKVAIYAHHREVIERLAAAFAAEGSSVYHGGMGDKEKEVAIAKFQGEGCRVFVGQRQAAGVGINGLQRVCATVVLAEPSWVPGETEQIIDRFDRIGQAEELVNAYLVYARDTLDGYVAKVHDRKVAVVGRLVDGAPRQDPRLVLGDLA